MWVGPYRWFLLIKDNSKFTAQNGPISPDNPPNCTLFFVIWAAWGHDKLIFQSIFDNKKSNKLTPFCFKRKVD